MLLSGKLPCVGDGFTVRFPKQPGLIRTDERPGFRQLQVSARTERIHPCLSPGIKGSLWYSTLHRNPARADYKEIALKAKNPAQSHASGVYHPLYLVVQTLSTGISRK